MSIDQDIVVRSLCDCVHSSYCLLTEFCFWTNWFKKHQLTVHDDKTVLTSDKRIPVGFERGDEIQEIVGARIINGKLCLYVLW
jgi:hypothetical protein